MILDKIKISLNGKDEEKGKVNDNGEVEVTIQLPSSKIVKSKLSKILSSRQSLENKTKQTENLIRETFTLFLKAKIPDLEEKKLSYEEIKQHVKDLDPELEEEINKQNVCEFLDTLIELSYAPYQHSEDPKKLKAEKKEKLEYIANQFRDLLW